MHIRETFISYLELSLMSFGKEMAAVQNYALKQFYGHILFAFHGKMSALFAMTLRTYVLYKSEMVIGCLEPL